MGVPSTSAPATSTLIIEENIRDSNCSVATVPQNELLEIVPIPAQNLSSGSSNCGKGRVSSNCSNMTIPLLHLAIGKETKKLHKELIATNSRIVMIAREFANSGRIEDAKKMYEACYTNCEDSVVEYVDFLKNLEFTAENQESLQKALREVLDVVQPKRGILSDNKHIELLNLYANILRKSNQNELALVYAEQSILMDGQHFDTMKLLAKILITQIAEHKQQIKTHEDILKSNQPIASTSSEGSSDIRGSLEQKLAVFKEQHAEVVKRSTQIIAKALHMVPEDYDCQIIFLELLVLQENFEQAIILSEKLIQNKEITEVDFFNYIKSLYDKEIYEPLSKQVVNYAAKGLSLNFQIKFVYAITLTKTQRKSKQAFEELKKELLQLEVLSQEIQSQIMIVGVYFCRKKDYQSAFECYSKIENFMMTSEDKIYKFAETAHKAGLHNEVVKILERHLESHKNCTNTKFFALLAKSYTIKGQTEKAQDYTRKFIQYNNQ